MSCYKYCSCCDTCLTLYNEVINPRICMHPPNNCSACSFYYCLITLFDVSLFQKLCVTTCSSINFVIAWMHIVNCFFPLQYVRLAGIFGMVWTGLMAVYWCITASLLSDLYRKYCDSGDFVCSDTRPKRFIILPILGNICMVGWVSITLYNMYI